MNKKISIIQKIDIAKLDNMIDEYQAITSETNPYLFMNKNTFSAIPQVDDLIPFLYQVQAKANGILGYYHGYKVFEDGGLKLGEVEIR